MHETVIFDFQQMAREEAAVWRTVLKFYATDQRRWPDSETSIGQLPLRITSLTDIHQTAHYYRAYATPRGRIARIASMRPIATDVARSAVCVSVGVLCT